MADLIGQRIGAYEIVALLGKGGMAEVYRARQQLGGKVARDVALKLIAARLSLTTEFIARFEREAQTLVSLSHPHILKAFDYGQYEDTVYLVMELLPGGSLAELIRKGSLALSDVSRLLEQTGQALDYAHSEGVIHRDLKPQNVLLDKSGNAFLTDFGIVKLLGETTSLTQSNAAIGTPAYMAPEQWTGGLVDARTDLYALGVMLFEMLGGQVPFTGDTPYRVMYRHTNEPPPSIAALRPDIPAGIDRVMGKALAKDPAARYQSAAALVADFKTAIAGHTVSAPPVSPTPAGPSAAGPIPVTAPFPTQQPVVPPTPSTARRLPIIGMVAGIVAVIVIVLGLGAALSGRTNATSTVTGTASSPPSSLTAAALLPTEGASPTPPVIAPGVTENSLPSPTLLARLLPTASVTVNVLNVVQTDQALSSTGTALAFTSMPTPTATLTPPPPASITPTLTELSPTSSSTSTLAPTSLPTSAATLPVLASIPPTATIPTETFTPTLTTTPNPGTKVAETLGALATMTANAQTSFTATPTPNEQETIEAAVQGTQTAVSLALATPTLAATPSPTLTQTMSLVPGTLRTDSKGIAQVWVPAGCFEMGSASDQDISTQIRGQSPRQVCLTSGYWIDRYEVSNAEYQKFIDEGGYQKQEYWTPAGWHWVQAGRHGGPHNFDGSTAPNQPRVGITLNEAIAYAHWRGGRVPTEAEWEYAARGPNSLIYPWGNTFEAGRANIRGVAGHTADVTAYENGLSWVGAYNMAGNAGEWVSDCFSATFDQQMVQDNPIGPCDGSNELVKGSSYLFNQFPARSTYRFVNSPGAFWIDVGVRIVSSPEGTP